jgi:hypothetical protein
LATGAYSAALSAASGYGSAVPLREKLVYVVMAARWESTIMVSICCVPSGVCHCQSCRHHGGVGDYPRTLMFEERTSKGGARTSDHSSIEPPSLKLRIHWKADPV